MSLSSHLKNLFRDLIFQVFQKKDMLLLLERLCKEEDKLIKPTDSSVEDPAKFPRPEAPQMGQSLTLFPSLLNGQGGKSIQDKVSQVCRPTTLHSRSTDMRQL